MLITKHLQSVVDNTVRWLCANGQLPAEVASQAINFQLEMPKNPDHGDYACNIAMLLTKAAKKPPRAIAELLIANWQDPNHIIARSEIAGPGFINIVLSNTVIHQVVGTVLKAGPTFGKTKKQKPQKVLVEFVSANPTGPLHLGHARSSFLGDTVARLLEASGDQVTREFYVNDHGNQIEVLGKSIYARYRELYGENITLGKDAYPAAYVIDIAKVLKEKDGDIWLNKAQDQWLPRCIEIGIGENLKDIKESLAKAGIEMDNWYSEESLYQKGLIEETIKAYRDCGMLYESIRSEGGAEKIRREDSNAAKYIDKQQGGTFLKTMQFGDEEDRILVRANGVPVYLAGDLAYHRDKFARGFDRMIDVFGADHAGHIPRLKAGMQALNLDEKKLEFLVVQIVRLIRGGEEVRFSKRSGEIYRLDELIEEIGPDVARFIFLMRASNSQFDFDLELALKQSNENPVFYVQYGHARMATLLQRAKEAGQDFVGADRVTDSQLAKLILPEERNMLKKMASFPEVIEQAAKHLEPHRVIYFCQDLIGDFHGYFTKYRQTERVISDDRDLTQGRLAMVASLKQTLSNALSILGISAPEHMEAE